MNIYYIMILHVFCTITTMCTHVAVVVCAVPAGTLAVRAFLIPNGNTSDTILLRICSVTIHATVYTQYANITQHES